MLGSLADRGRTVLSGVCTVEAQLQRRIQRYGWDKSARLYEHHWRDALAPAHDRLLARAAIRPGERVLDVACGNGLVSLRAAAATGPTGAVTGTDLSDAMVALARGSAAAGGIEQASFARMDAEALDLPDASFDVALCALGLMYMPEPERALAEMCRTLRTGGRMIVAVWGRRDRCGWRDLFPIVDARVRSQVCPLFFRLGGDGALAAALHDAGFAAVEIERLATTIAWATGEDACDAAFLAGPVALAYARFDAETRAAVRDEYLQSLERYRAGDGYHVPAEFVIGGGTRP